MIGRVVLLVVTAIGSAAAVVLAVSAFLVVGWTAVAVIVLSIVALLWGGGRIARIAIERSRHQSPRDRQHRRAAARGSGDPRRWRDRRLI